MILSRRRSVPRRSLLVLAIAGATLTHSSPAHAADPPQPPESSGAGLAERRAAEAYDAYGRKDYASAVALYLQAFDASPSGIILFNVARIYDTKLGDRPLAMTFYRRYISDPGADVDRIKLANQRLTELRAAEAMSSQVASTSASTATSGSSPPRGSPTPPAPPPVDGEHGGWSALRWTGVTLGALGVGGVVVGTLYGLAAASKTNTARQTCDGASCTTQAGVDALHSASNDATVSTVGFAAGGALLAAGTALFFFGAGKKSPERPSTASLRWDVSAAPSELTLHVQGAW
ncbi:MAG TPA: hypothetical protein VGM06_11140 [Polyangiaceae bacterium]|jgi:tetratricopeptide (TPR) repeat protein